MRIPGLLLASCRRVMVAVGVVAVLSATSTMSAMAQDPAKPQEPAKPAEQADPLKFDYDGPMLLVFQIKPDRIADFEAFWPGLRSGLAKSQKPELKAFSETLTPYKVQGVQGLYLLRIDQPSKTFSYNPSKLLYDNINYEKPAEGAFTREEADALFKKFNESWVAQGGIQAWKLEKVGTPAP